MNGVGQRGEMGNDVQGVTGKIGEQGKGILRNTER